MKSTTEFVPIYNKMEQREIDAYQTICSLLRNNHFSKAAIGHLKYLLDCSEIIGSS